MRKLTEKKTSEIKKLLELNRIKILQILLKQDTCVCQLVKKLNLKHNLISHHLKVLQNMGYIQSKRNGQHIIYNLERSKYIVVAELLDIVKR